jgi:hypothetical protein
MTYSRRLYLPMMMTCAVLALGACSRGDDDRLAGELAPPERVDVLAPPVAPDPSQMHPALQIARSRGLKTNVYFNEELQQAVARLNGMEETLGRLQNDLQGTAMAMQRVEMMRQEIDALNVRFQSLQERLMYAGPVMAPPPTPEDVIDQQAMNAAGMEQTTTTTTTTTGDGGDMPMTAGPTAMTTGGSAMPNGPTPLTGAMASPDVKTAQMKPVVDEKAAKAAPAKTAAPSAAAKAGPGVNDVRFGVHGDTVRVVLDVTGSADGYKAAVASGDNIMTIELPNTKWSATATQKVSNNPLIAAYSAQPAGSGSVVAFSLKGPTKIVKSSVLKNPTRVVIDLSK